MDIHLVRAVTIEVDGETKTFAPGHHVVHDDNKKVIAELMKLPEDAFEEAPAWPS
ncbi:MAG: hypothetical protein M9894_00605 [Planctomycetes bacterium]|nr:hypothetical protein [Planctomycetota bacterium]